MTILLQGGQEYNREVAVSDVVLEDVLLGRDAPIGIPLLATFLSKRGGDVGGLVWRPAPSLREEGSGLACINSLYTVARFLLPLIFIYSCIINGLIIIILINHEYGTQ